MDGVALEGLIMYDLREGIGWDEEVLVESDQGTGDEFAGD